MTWFDVYAFGVKLCLALYLDGMSPAEWWVYADRYNELIGDVKHSFVIESRVKKAISILKAETP